MQAIASAWNWMFVFVVVKITPIAFGSSPIMHSLITSSFPPSIKLNIIIASISWHTFIIFAILNAVFLPMVYCFYPETQGITLEDIPLLSNKGGITGGVWSSKGGKTVIPGQHAQESHVNEKMGTEQEERNVVEEVKA